MCGPAHFQLISLPILNLKMTQLTEPPNSKLLTKDELLAVLIRWYRAPESERPPLFPGMLAEKSKLDSWLGDIVAHCVALERPIPQQQWVKVVLAWIPEAGRGKIGLREQLLSGMREKRRTGEWEMDRFWDWEKFQVLFFETCARNVKKRRLKMGAFISGAVLLGGAAVGGAALVMLPTAGSETIARMASDAVARSVAVASARSVFPAAYNSLLRTVGTLGAAVGAIGSAIDKGEPSSHEPTENLEDANDNENDLPGDIEDVP
ncbi:hypothetical protein D9756_008841 [Leucocoprinus leucothites]|uniref:Transmembrane protein n=1 Tax=Leucocoprinus leucothites TaxID=201217 RepID=A0A8H5CYW8_9AGAR|nr:hypothetical protein D9756_008841 [Leucoagaricus leucothites]